MKGVSGELKKVQTMYSADLVLGLVQADHLDLLLYDIVPILQRIDKMVSYALHVTLSPESQLGVEEISYQNENISSNAIYNNRKFCNSREF